MTTSKKLQHEPLSSAAAALPILAPLWCILEQTPIIGNFRPVHVRFGLAHVMRHHSHPRMRYYVYYTVCGSLGWAQATSVLHVHKCMVQHVRLSTTQEQFVVSNRKLPTTAPLLDCILLCSVTFQNDRCWGKLWRGHPDDVPPSSQPKREQLLRLVLKDTPPNGDAVSMGVYYHHGVQRELRESGVVRIR